MILLKFKKDWLASCLSLFIGIYQRSKKEQDKAQQKVEVKFLDKGGTHNRRVYVHVVWKKSEKEKK